MIDDKQIIELLFERSEKGLVELDVKYGKLCHKLSYNILNNRQDAEECVNDAYLGVWNAIPPAKPNPLQAYVCKVVRNIALKLYHKKGAEKRNSEYDIAMQELEGYLPAPDTVEAEMDTRELAFMIENFLDTLNDENAVIFLRRYWFSDTYAEIAERTGISEKSVSMRLVRIRKQMKQYLLEREVYV
ncbi:MAG: sigma-70 family RNA polymerase sigma factor [Acutalibacter sp.]|nr:sigma-70 family RNA polymerase sigma factor [Acutalibacter sp.]